MATIQRAAVQRGDLSLWDGVTKTASRFDATGGTVTGLTIGETVDVLQVFGSGTDRTRATIATAVSRLGSSRVSLLFATGTWSIDDDLTIPSNFSCQVPAGCVFSVDSGQVLTFEGSLWVEDPSSWDTGAGSIVSTAGIQGAVTLTTAAEIADGVTPVNFQYEEYDPRRYYSSSWATAIQTALDLGEPRIIQLPEGTLACGDATLSVRVGGGLVGHGVDSTSLTFTGNVDAIAAATAQWVTLKDFSILDARAAASRTAGAGIHLTGFGGPCLVENVNIGPVSFPTNFGFLTGVKETDGQLNRRFLNVRSTWAKEDAFLLDGPTTSSVLISCYANAPGRDGFRFTANHTYCSLIATACDAPDGIGYNFIGNADGHQLGITLIAPGCEFNSATFTTTNALKITQGRHFEIITPFFSGSSGLSGDCILIEGDAGFTTTNITIRGGFAKDSASGSGISIGANCSRIRNEGCDLGNNSAGRVNAGANSDLLTEFLPADGNEAYEFRRPVLVGHSIVTSMAIGDIATKNARGLRGVNAAGTDTVAIIDLDSANRVQLAAAGGDIRWGTALVALGGGAAPTLGTIGGSGPATAGQNTWMRVVDSSGAAFWVPAWK